MLRPSKAKLLSEREVQAIIEKYDGESLTISTSYIDGGVDPLPLPYLPTLCATTLFRPCAK